MKVNLENIVKESFSQYSGAVLQSRALVDVRDCLKPSARQIFFSMKERKLTHKNPFKKTANAVGMAMADYYLHGDSSCEGIIMRAGQPFAYRYPLIEVEGSYGNLIESGNWAAPRYTSSRLSKIAEYLFKNLEKNSISDWRDSYDNTKQYPMVLSSLGFFNIVNGSLGIGVGASSSIPQFNLREVNQSLIKLLWNPEIPDDELICLPDFATGGILLNEEEVRQSLIYGKGKAIKLRSVIEYDEKDRCLIVKEIPYSVYTNTICKQLENLIESQPTLGINHFNDLTGEHPYIKIYLNKNVNPSKVLKTLYQETSLQYHYSINFTMLEDGKFPKVFTWKEILNSHLNHEKKVYRKSFEYDLSKIQERIHILQGLLIALASINEVIEIIKKSGSSIEAAIQLQSNFELDEVQAKAILDLKLARLAKLEVNKLQSELLSLEKEQEKLNNILADTSLFYKEIEKGLNNVINEFGDIIYNFKRVSPGWKELFADNNYYKEGDSFSTFQYKNLIFTVGLCGDFWDDRNILKAGNLKKDITLWPLYVSFSIQDFESKYKQEYVERASKLNSRVLFINSISKDPDAFGGCFEFYDGQILNELPFGEEGLLYVEV